MLSDMPRVHQVTCSSIPSHGIYGLLQNVLDLLVRRFCLATRLAMIWSCNIVLYPKLFQEVSEGLINEMRPSVTYDHPWCSKAWENDLMEHFSGMLGVCSVTG